MGNIKLKTPNQHSRAKRAQEAKSFLNISVPAILKSNKRAKAGVDSAELFLQLPPVSQDDLIPSVSRSRTSRPHWQIMVTQ